MASIAATSGIKTDKASFRTMTVKESNYCTATIVCYAANIEWCIYSDQSFAQRCSLEN